VLLEHAVLHAPGIRRAPDDAVVRCRLDPDSPRAVRRNPVEVDRTEISPMSVLTEVTVAPLLRRAAAIARTSAPRSASTTYVPDPADDEAAVADVVVCRAAVAVVPPSAVVARATAPMRATMRDRRIRLLLPWGKAGASRPIRRP
jgi:hypothetical protein